MKKFAVFFLGFGLMCAATASPLQPVDFTDEDWVNAARLALSLAHRGHPTIVMNGNLSPSAERGLKDVGEAMRFADLLDKSDKASGDGYLYIKQFEPIGDRYEFLSISNVDRKSVGTDCGLTSHFFLSRVGTGTWKQDDPVRITMCWHSEKKEQ
jgi:hypothetical protein